MLPYYFGVFQQYMCYNIGNVFVKSERDDNNKQGKEYGEKDN